jgi:hypothetical protein
MVEGGGFEPPKLARQIYSLIPLATREPLQEGAHSLDLQALCQPLYCAIFPFWPMLFCPRRTILVLSLSIAKFQRPNQKQPR